MVQTLLDAVKENQFEKAKLLIEKGANVNSKDKYGDTPLHAAILQGNIEIAKLLLKNGADINAKDNSGFTVMHNCHSPEVVAYLIEKGADINARDRLGLTPLHWAVKQGYQATVELLIEYKADINIQDNYGNIPLHFTKDIGIGALLIEKGANVNAKSNSNDSGYTLLHLAAQDGNTAIIELLIKHKADITANDSDGRTPLHRAKDVGTVALLIEKGAEMNAKDNDGNTPLHWAAKKWNPAVVELLIGKGVDIIANKYDKLPSELAKNEVVREKLKNYEKSKMADFEKDLIDTQDKLTQVLSEKNELLEKASKVQKELRDLKREHPVLEKVLSDMKEEFSKCNLAKSLDQAVKGLEEIKGELPSYYAYPSGSGRVSFEETINTILNDTKLLDSTSMKSKVFKTVEGMLNMLKTCGAQSEDKLYAIADQVQEIKDKLGNIDDDFDPLPLPSDSSMFSLV